MVRTLLGWRSARFTLALGEESKRISGYFVAVANNSVYGGGMYIAPDAELDDGEFDVVSIGEGGKLQFLWGLKDVLKGSHLSKDSVDVFRTPRLDLDASRPFPVYADGDHLTDLPVSLRVLPRSLSILVPPAEES
jgi:diacylglycerol kinase family enzyme